MLYYGNIEMLNYGSDTLFKDILPYCYLKEKRKNDHGISKIKIFSYLLRADEVKRKKNQTPCCSFIINHAKQNNINYHFCQSIKRQTYIKCPQSHSCISTSDRRKRNSQSQTISNLCSHTGTCLRLPT